MTGRDSVEVPGRANCSTEGSTASALSACRNCRESPFMEPGCVKAGKVRVEAAKPSVCERFLLNSSSRVSSVEEASHRMFGGVVEVLEARSTPPSVEEVREKSEPEVSVFVPSLFLVFEEATVQTEICLARFMSSGTSRVPAAGAGVFFGDGDRVRGLAARSGWAATKALKLGSVLGSGMVQGKRRKIMHMKMIATLHTSVFLGS